MSKILISGYYGFHNIGDESILKAVVEGLRAKLPDVQITVLSQNPESTASKHGVKSLNRKSIPAILSGVLDCDLLISGGGSLLQDVTSKRSILYYLMIMWLALLFGKKLFIYSQGIGPINGRWNRRLTAMTLRRADGIAVRDEASKELLIEIGLAAGKIVVTADPVLRLKKADLSVGQAILAQEGFSKMEGRLTVGWAIREKKPGSDFLEEVIRSIQELQARYQAQIVLIPFHFSEDMAVLDQIADRMGDSVCCVRHKYLTEEMMSIIGNMDVLVGVRLHSLIHAAIMNVPMIAISYDPKVNSFMHSIDLRAMSSVIDFRSEFFLEEFEKTINQAPQIKSRVEKKLSGLVEKLAKTEQIIEEILAS